MTEGKRELSQCAAVKNSGKDDTACTNDRKIFRRGVRTAVIKHDGHDFPVTFRGQTVSGSKRPGHTERQSSLQRALSYTEPNFIQNPGRRKRRG